MLRLIRWTAFAVMAVLMIASGVIWLRGDMAGVSQAVAGLPGGIEVGGPFTLADAQGKTVTDAAFRGRWMLVYFGYSFCPDICPTELQTMVSSLDPLGTLSEKVSPVFITVDPERDTGQALADYTRLFDARLVGLTGTADQIAKVAREYRVYYAKVTPKDSSSYVMDHSSFIYLMGPDGKLAALFKQGTTGQDIADALRKRITAS
jgi:protein SCO1/2